MQVPISYNGREEHEYAECNKQGERTWHFVTHPRWDFADRAGFVCAPMWQRFAVGRPDAREPSRAVRAPLCGRFCFCFLVGGPTCFRLIAGRCRSHDGVPAT